MLHCEHAEHGFGYLICRGLPNPDPGGLGAHSVYVICGCYFAVTRGVTPRLRELRAYHLVR